MRPYAARYLYMSVQNVGAQVHSMYPLKYNEQWEAMEEEVEDLELARRYFRARRNALADISLQAIKVKTADACATSADVDAQAAQAIAASKAAECADTLGEALRLEDDNPFLHQTAIRKMRKRAEELSAARDAAAAQASAAEQTREHWQRVAKDEERHLFSLVELATPLLEHAQEAQTLKLWHLVHVLPPPYSLLPPES